MRIQSVLTQLTLAIFSGVAFAGSFCPSTPSKCPIECCPDVGASVSVGYETDYILYGVRLARDSMWADVNYTFEFIKPITIGAWHLTSLGSGISSPNFDETDLYVSVDLGEVLGFKTSAGIIHFMYPNLRGPSGTATTGDSTTETWAKIERQVCGFNIFYRRAYDKVIPGALADVITANRDNGAWQHTFGVERSLCLTANIGLDLSGGVLYSDNYWPADTTAAFDGTFDRRTSTGWNSYYVRAAFPIELNCRSVLTPYIGYNGAPDGWIADGVNTFGPGTTQNANDVLHGGVSLSVEF